jgi:hypothetical protein
MTITPMTKPTRKPQPAPAKPADPIVQSSWRCRRSVAGALKVYAAQREAAGLEPYTQQEIIAVAVEEFMRRNPIK